MTANDSPALRCDLLLEPARGVVVRPKFTLTAGTLVVFGPSGAGKTVTLRALAGLLRPSLGRLELGGEVLIEATRGRSGSGSQTALRFVSPQARGVGYAPQHAALFPHLDVRANILAGLPAESPEAPSFLDLVDALALAHLVDRRPAALSGGERQRVSLARALARGPRLLLLDEPLSAIDLGERRHIAAWLKTLLRKLHLTTVLVTHDPLEALAMGDHLALLQGGRTVAEGAPAEVLRSHGLVPQFLLDHFRTS